MVGDGLIAPPGTTNQQHDRRGFSQVGVLESHPRKDQRPPGLKPARTTCANPRGGILLRSRRANQHR